MHVVRHGNAVQFLTEAQSWLSATEVENNVPLGVARRLAEAGNDDPSFYWATIHDRGSVVGCAFRTPPYSVAVTRMPQDAIDPLASDLIQTGEALPGVGGPSDEAQQFADVWTAQTGLTSRVRTRLLIHELTDVQLPENPPSGGLRPVLDSERDLIRSWAASFVYDTGIAQDPEAAAERLINSPTVRIWDDDGPRCLVASNRDTPHGACIGPVYTPNIDRGKGYASAAVATLSDEILQGGKSFCCLYTDAANPTSNSIYRRIGYRPVREDVDIDFI